MHAELLAAYPGEYVAIYRGQVVDRDPDQFALYRRIEATYADAAVLIRQITLEPQETYVFRSHGLMNHERAVHLSLQSKLSAGHARY
jgi:hypothetical protein